MPDHIRILGLSFIHKVLGVLLDTVVNYERNLLLVFLDVNNTIFFKYGSLIKSSQRSFVPHGANLINKLWS
jgi:hypothetical protein